MIIFFLPLEEEQSSTSLPFAKISPPSFLPDVLKTRFIKSVSPSWITHNICQNHMQLIFYPLQNSPRKYKSVLCCCPFTRARKFFLLLRASLGNDDGDWVAGQVLVVRRGHYGLLLPLLPLLLRHAADNISNQVNIIAARGGRERERERGLLSLQQTLYRTTTHTHTRTINPHLCGGVRVWEAPFARDWRLQDDDDVGIGLVTFVCV